MLIGLLGAGAQAREIEDWIGADAIAFRAVDPAFAVGDLVSVTSPNPEQHATAVVAAVGTPGLRRGLVESWPGGHFSKVVVDCALVSSSAALGDGAVVGPGAVVSVGVRTGRHSLINIGATLSHDVTLGDYVTVSPGANIGGHVVIGDGVWIGIGATVIDDIRIASGVVVGAGAVVVSDIVTPNAVVVGVPARTSYVREVWLTSTNRRSDARPGSPEPPGGFE